MSLASEYAKAPGQLQTALDAGLTNLDRAEPVLFTKYVRLVLPADGFVFWVRANLVSRTALYNSGLMGAVEPNSNEVQAPVTQEVQGSFHVSVEKDQREDETISVNTCLFSTTTEIQAFNEISQGVIYIGVFQGIRFAFSRRGNFYQQAGVYHYLGDAVYPAFESQIIDGPGFDTVHRVVSNSLPLWLALMQSGPIYPLLPAYPAFLVPTNAVPPYAAIHVQATKPLQAFPAKDALGGSQQLVTDHVQITLYGVRNDAAIDLQNAVNDYSVATDNLGVMNLPVWTDDYRTQAELGIIAQKKTINYDVSYYQSRADTVARQLILSAVPTFYLE